MAPHDRHRTSYVQRCEIYLPSRKQRSSVRAVSKSVSDVLRASIQRSALSRYEIAKRSGVEQSSLSRFFSGERGLSQGAIDALCALLGLHLVVRKPRKRGKR